MVLQYELGDTLCVAPREKAYPLLKIFALIFFALSRDNFFLTSFHYFFEGATHCVSRSSYATRAAQDRHLTIHQFFHKEKTIPLFPPLHTQNTFHIMLVPVHNRLSHHQFHLQDPWYSYIHLGVSGSMTIKIL